MTRGSVRSPLLRPPSSGTRLRLDCAGRSASNWAYDTYHHVKERGCHLEATFAHHDLHRATASHGMSILRARGNRRHDAGQLLLVL